MPILLTNQQLIGIDIFFIEEIKQHGNTVFKFIRSKEEFDELKNDGYKTLDEINQLKSQQGPKSTVDKLPGAPVSPGSSSALAYDEKKIIQKLNTQWKRLTWKEQNDITSKCLISYAQADGSVNYQLDIMRFKELKLKTCLKKWSLTYDNGQPVEVNNDNIDLLDPSIGEEMIKSFERVTGSNLEEEEKSNK